MKLLNAQQIRELDQQTILVQNIESADLMRRASKVYFTELMNHIKGHFKNMVVFSGSGNNGGDGIAIASLCAPYFETVDIVLCNIGNRSNDLKEMLEEVNEKVQIIELNKGEDIDISLGRSLVIDAIFGSGLNREVTGYWASLISYINNYSAYICSVDIPSGMFSDHLNKTNNIIEADWTLSFELPKPSFFFPENGNYLGKWQTASIGLDKTTLEAMESTEYVVDEDLIKSIFKNRERHSHKGTCGHAALITGSYGMSGAAILAAKGCLRSGVGKLSCYVPEVTLNLIQSQVPEAICAGNNGFQCIESINFTLDYDAIGLGCGIGKNLVTKSALRKFFGIYHDIPMVIDADALNIIAEEEWIDLIPKGSLLTPHIGEFDRMFGKSRNSEDRMDLLQEKAESLNLSILLITILFPE